MRACRYLGVDFCAAHGIGYGPIVEAWALLAEAAEQEAEAELVKQAREQTAKGR